MKDDSLYQSLNLKKAKLILLVVVFLSIVFTVVFWLYSHAYITITLASVDDKTATYSLKNQSDNSTVTLKNKSGSIKKLVAKGDYEVTVSHGTTSYYRNLSTGSFLATSIVTAKLQPEKARRFVGNNPSQCMDYLPTQSLLYSYDCQGSFSGLKVHVPASAQTPTIAVSPDQKLGDLVVGGSAQIGQKVVMLLNGLSIGEEGQTTPIIYELTKNLDLKKSFIPAGVNKDGFYKIIAYKQGFVLYTSNLKQVLYYRNLDATPTKISIKKPTEAGLRPLELSAHKDKLVAIYTNNLSGETESGDSLKTSRGGSKTAFQIYQDGKTRSVIIDSAYTNATLCGQQQLCVINNKTLAIYDATQQNPKQLFTVSSATGVLNDGENIIVLRKNDTLSLNLASKTGYRQYSSGDYSLCGAQSVSTGGYVLCVAKPDGGDSSALYINPAINNLDDIDKKILSLSTQPYIDTVSAYGKYIYIVPNLGELVYNKALNGYEPDPTIRKQTAADITKFVDDLKINRSKYTIINTQL